MEYLTMQRYKNLTRMGLTLVLAAVGVLFSGTELLSQKKPGAGGGTAPAGRIYYTWGSDPDFYSHGSWSMKADGSGKQQEAYQPADQNHLSYAVHGGSRWYLELRPSPTDGSRQAIFAVRDDGTDAVMLLEVADLPADMVLEFPRWGKDDSFVSFVGIEFDPEAVDKIWAFVVGFDPQTNLPQAWTAPVTVVEGHGPHFVDPTYSHNRFGLHDWSPNGKEVVYTWQDESGFTSLYIHNIVDNKTRHLVLDAIDALWSPDGTKIAFLRAGIEVIKPDGTNRLALGISGWLGGWSPDSQHLVYTYSWEKRSTYYADVMRIPATGGTATNLTKDIDGFAWTVDSWR
jgi:hypothetical protein